MNECLIDVRDGNRNGTVEEIKRLTLVSGTLAEV